jgi:hypothetical protein
MTLFYKFIFPTLWLAGFASGTLFMFRHIEPTGWVGGDAPPTHVRWAFLGATVVGVIAFSSTCMRFKKVSVTGDQLLVSNYVRTIQVPLTNVARITGTVLVGPAMIWISFHEPTPFGHRIVFMPSVRRSSMLRVHPVAGELQGLVDRARLQADPNVATSGA